MNEILEDLPTVRLAVVDVDGCLTRGESHAWNWRVLQAIQALNRRAQQGGTVPAVTLCTGRAEPYVEVLMQAIDAFLPGVYENGCGLYLPRQYRFAEHPSITAEFREVLNHTKALLYRQIVASGLGYFQPGKELSLCIYPLPPMSVDELHQIVADLLPAQNNQFTVQTSASCVDITPSGVDKGAGVRWLSERTGILLGQMGGIGDSIGDLPFLRLVGHSAAPANAADEVKSAVAYVSPLPDGEGVLDILERWCDEL